MKSLKNLREAIIWAHNRGKGQREIADFLGNLRALSTRLSNGSKKREAMKIVLDEAQRRPLEARRMCNAP